MNSSQVSSLTARWGHSNPLRFWMLAAFLFVASAFGSATAHAQTFTGTLGNNSTTYPGTSATQTGRLFRNAVASTCAAPKAAPTFFDTTGTRAYDAYRLTNPSASAACVNVSYTLNGGSGNGLFAVAYLTSFNSTDVSANYLADPGSSVIPSAPGPNVFSFTIPPLATVVLVIHEVDPATNVGATYNVTISGLPAPIGGEVASLVVTTADDVVADDGVTSLREAVAFANRDSGNSAITFAVAGILTLTGSELTLANDGKVSLTASAVGVTISGNNKGRVFNIATGGDATLNGVTLTGGNAATGGAILNNGALTLNGSTLFGNNATGDGGAISNNGALTTINVTLVGNTAGGNGGAIFNSSVATLTSLNSTFLANSAQSGGGIFKGQTLNLTNTIVVENTGGNLSGVADAGGNNITGGTNAAAGLDPFGLRDNGGAVRTIALTTRGTAVNAGDNVAAAGLATDGRGAGFPRVVSGKVDIGAFESAFGNRAPVLNNATYSTSVNVPFSQQLAGNDPDSDSLSYARASGTLPVGITLSRTGLLAGTPTVVGRYDFSVNVFDGTDTTVARFIIIVSSNADGIGPVITRSALNASYTRDELAALIYRGQVRDVAPANVTPSGVSQVTFQLRRDSDGFAYSGSETTGFTSNVNLGYFPAFLSEPTPNTTAGTRDFRRTFGANGFVPSASVLTPGKYSLVIVAKDVAGNFSVEVVPFTITATTSSAARATVATPSGSAAVRNDSGGNS